MLSISGTRVRPGTAGWRCFRSGYRLCSALLCQQGWGDGNTHHMFGGDHVMRVMSAGCRTALAAKAAIVLWVCRNCGFVAARQAPGRSYWRRAALTERCPLIFLRQRGINRASHVCDRTGWLRGFRISPRSPGRCRNATLRLVTFRYFVADLCGAGIVDCRFVGLTNQPDPPQDNRRSVFQRDALLHLQRVHHRWKRLSSAAYHAVQL